MTEWEKMCAGRLYDAGCEALVAARTACKDLCHAYNLCLPSDTARRRELLRAIIGTLEGEAELTAPFFCDYGRNITLGDGVYLNHNCTILDCAPVRIGARTLLGPNCCLTTAAHPLPAQQRAQGLEYAREITIGCDVWLGAGVTVLPGVTIGDGSVIGAGSVVTRDIPPGVVALGVPCRVIRPVTERDWMEE